MTTAPVFEPPVLSMLVNLQTASVPAFAPVGANAEHFSSHRWGPEPMPEVVAHATGTWPSVHCAADFAAGLTLEQFDATDIARLAVSLGAGQLVAVARDTDGVAWWPTDNGPTVARDVLGALAIAANDAGLAFGVALCPTDSVVADVAELTERYAPATFRELWVRPVADGTWAPTPDWATTTPVARRLPDDPPGTPWELRSGFGLSLGYNQLERSPDFTSTAVLCAMVASTRARGGSMLLDVALTAQGDVPAAVRQAAQALAPWLSQHAPDFARCTAFDVEGDDTVRYMARPGDTPGTRDVVVVDLDAKWRRSIAHFSPHRYPIVAVSGAKSWSQDTAGVHLIAPDDALQSVQGKGLPVVTILTMTDRRRMTLAVQGRRTPGTVHIGDAPFATIGEALQVAQPGEVVSASAGRFGPESESLPLVVPAGVTLLGPNPLRRATALGVDRAGELSVDLVGGGTLVVLGGDGATLRQISVRDESQPLSARVPVVRVDGARDVVLDGCEFQGHVGLVDIAGASLTWNRFEIGGISIRRGSHISLVGNRFVHGLANDAAISVCDATDVRIEATSCLDTDVGISLVSVTDARLSGNATNARRHGIEVRHTTDALLSGNRVTAMRGLLIDHCIDVEVSASSVMRADTAMLIVASAGVAVTGTHLTEARVGLMFTAGSGDRGSWDIDQFAAATEAALVEVPGPWPPGNTPP